MASFGSDTSEQFTKVFSLEGFPLYSINELLPFRLVSVQISTVQIGEDLLYIVHMYYTLHCLYMGLRPGQHKIM